MTSSEHTGSEPAVSGLLAVAVRGGLEIRCATHVVSDAGKTLGGVYGPVSESEASALVHRLRGHDDPLGPDCPWAAVALRPDGSVAAAAASMLTSGLFHASDPSPAGQQLTLATDPVRVREARPVPTMLDEDYLKAFPTEQLPVRATPYVGVSRTPTGETLRWRDGSSSLIQWLGPQTRPPRTLRGEEARAAYLETFDEVVADLAARTTGPLVATISGGLDSTFMAASLARVATPDRPIHGFCYSPPPDSTSEQRPGWVADDFPYAKLMEESYPGLIVMAPMRNEAGITPREAAIAAMRLSGMPAWAPSNQIWLNDIVGRAQALGASSLFVGNWGNSTFSGAGAYSAAMLASESLLGSLRLLGPSHYSDSTRVAVARRVAGSHRLLRRDPEGGELTEADVAGWMTGHLRGNPAAGNPRLLGGVARMDPFASRRIVELALRITWGTWVQGPDARGFARSLAMGRTSPKIHLRRERGAQSTWDKQRRDALIQHRVKAAEDFTLIWSR